MDARSKSSVGSSKKGQKVISRDTRTLKALDAISQAILNVYPKQKNHVQAASKTKYCKGGPDPLDLVSILIHQGDSTTPEHWHYISYGLSDLYGDGRITNFKPGSELSGFGYELAFRLRKKEDSPPVWPINLLNGLARYIYKTSLALSPGDHIPWHCSLDPKASSPIRHLLVTEDPELQLIVCQSGQLTFRQLVGISDDELRLVQRWSGRRVLEYLRQQTSLGGPLLVTDMTRQVTPPRSLMAREDGARLGHVIALCGWEENNVPSDVSAPVREIPSVTLKFDLETAALLPIAIGQRLQRGHYFIFQNLVDQILLFVPYNFEADLVIVDQERPLCVQGQALQIYCSAELIEALITDLVILENTKELEDKLPIKFEIDKPPLTMVIEPREQLMKFIDIDKNS